MTGKRAPAAKRVSTNDSLASIMTGAGTTVDKRTSQHWSMRTLNFLEVELAYRTSWLMRNVVNIPPHDMTRAWRDWQATDAQIEAIEKVEKRLKVRDKVRKALILGRLGGGLIIMGCRQGTASAALNPEELGADDLRYLHVVSRYKVSLGPLEEDPDSDDFGEPKWFKLRGKHKEATIHASRCIVFKGEMGPGLSGVGSTSTGEDAYWGDSIVQIVNDAVMNATTAQDEIAGLIAEAKIDVFGIPDLLSSMGDKAAERRIMRRLELANEGKSNHRALIRDAAETWEQRQITWAGMPEIIRTYLSIVAGASQIPATRLLGKSPDGMNATGEGDEDNFDDLISSLQSSELAPALETLDDVLIRSALGSRPPEVYYEFAPLKVMDEKEQAEVENKFADTVTKIVNSGLIPDEALAQALANRMMESGLWPSLEAALKAIGEKWWEVAAEENVEPPEAAPPAPSNQPGNGGGGGPGGVPVGV